MPEDRDEILTLAEIARYLKVSEKTILRMVQAGEFPALKVANQWRFVRGRVNDWLNGRMHAVPTESLRDLAGASLRLLPLTRLVSDRRIVLPLRPGGKRDVLAQLVAPLVEEGLVGDAEAYTERLVEREQVVSTALGQGLAVPHVREPAASGVATPCIVMGICPEGTDFEALDGGRTYLFAMPCAGNEAAHLGLLARIALLFRRPGLPDALRGARTRNEVTALLAEADREPAARGAGA
jgi:PTS system nitrogen regulatory IIA component